MPAPRLPEFRAEVAERFVRSSDRAAGLSQYLGLRIVDMAPGRLTAEMVVDEKLLTGFGNMHGGVLSAFCDHVLGSVCYPHMRPGQWAATTEFKINLMAPVARGRVEARAEIISMTTRTAVVRIEMENEGRLCCSAQGTVLIQDPKPS